MKKINQIKRILSILICLSLLFTYVPVSLADEANPLPQTPAAYAASDYAKYASRMAMGEAHIAVINANGTLVVGGDNTHDQCNVPEELGGVKVKAVAAGTNHTLALTEDGRVIQWGSKRIEGGGMGAVPIPDEVKTVQGDIKQISAGGNMSAVLTNSNQLIVWGYNSNGLSAVPEGLGNVVAVAINDFCVVTLNDEGNVKVWGDTNCNIVPDGLEGNVVAIAAGQWHWLALKKDGTVSVTGSSVMTKKCGEIAQQTDVRAIVGGWQFAGAILSDGSVKGWGRTPAGYNTAGQEQVPPGVNIRAFVCTVSGGLGDSPALCAMQGDGTIKVIAPSEFTTVPITDKFNFLTIPGDDANLSGLEVAGYTLSPAFDSSIGTYTVNVPTDVSSVNITATTTDSSATLKINGAVAAGGIPQKVSNLAEGDNLIPVVVTAADFKTVKTYNLTIRREPLTETNNPYLSSLEAAGYTLNQAFDATTTAYSITVPYETDNVDITATTAVPGAGLKINGSAAASGIAQKVSNLVVGANPIVVEVTSADGTTVKTYTLTIKRLKEEIHLPQTPIAYLASDLAKYASRMAVGDAHIAVIDAGGKLTLGGDNTYGQCNVPEGLTGAKVKAVAAGTHHTLALTEDGRVFAWGQCVSDENGTKSPVTLPAEVEAVQGDIKLIAAGGNMSAILTNSNQLIVWGYNSNNLSVVPEGLGNVVNIAINKYCVVTLNDEGNVKVWGDGKCNVVPDGLGGNVVAIAAGYWHWLALKKDGTVSVTGDSSMTKRCGKIADQVNVRAIVGGWRFAGAILSDGSVKGWGATPIGLKTAGIELIAADASIKAFTSIVSSDTNNSGICAMQGDGTIKTVCYSGFTTSPITDQFNFLTGLNNNANLSSLAVTGYGLDKTFVAGTSEYTVNVPNEVSCVKITATTADSGAALKINGAEAVSGTAQTVDNLIVGDNPVAVAVTAADGTTTKTYTLTIKRAGEAASPDDNSLAGLTVASVVDEGGEAQVATCGIYPEFKSDWTEGIVDVAYETAEVHITARPASGSAALEINGEPAAAGVATVINAQNLEVGDNPISIKVTAANGSQRSYTLHVKRVSDGYALPSLPQTTEAYQASEYAKHARRLGPSNSHVLTLKKDGTVAAWGEAKDGPCNVPAGLDQVVAVAAGYQYSLALRTDGAVTAWGKNDKGQCGVPAGLENAADISAGYSFAAALDKNGQVFTWGDNTSGQCDVPAGLSNVVDIQCGSHYTLALKADGTVTAWGKNDMGQCGVPAGLDHVVAIAASTRYSAALKDDGTMVIWGAKDSNYEIKNLDLQYVKAIAAGSDYIAALKWDGSLAVWGNYHWKHVDLGVPLILGKKVLAISSPGSGKYLLALNEDGTLMGTLAAWASQDDKRPCQCDIPSGLNLFADDIPYGGPSPNIPQTPAAYAASDYARARSKICNVFTGFAVLNMDGTVKVKVTGRDDYDLAKVPADLRNVKAIATAHAGYNVMALKEDGTVVVWGYNGDGQCKVPEGLSNVTAIAMGNIFSPCCLALKEDGTVVAWGGNLYGQCDIPANLSNVAAVAAGGNYCLALKKDGTVVAWGNNDYGQCNVPAGLNNVDRIYASEFYDFSVALKKDGTVVAWGNNYDRFKKYYCGQCDVPEGLSGVVDLFIDGNTCYALKSNGTVVVWGDNTYGRRNVPAGLHDVAAISRACGSAAIKTDGTVVNWGYSPGQSDLLTGLSKVLTISDTGIVIFRDGTLGYCYDYPYSDEINSALTGLNVLSGHYFAVNNVELLNPEGQSITSVAKQGSYRIKTQVANNYAGPTAGLTIIQVRAGAGAASTGGGQVLGCVGLSGDIPVTGSTVSSDFNMPADAGGPAYVDVFVWDGWDSMVPRAAANQGLSFGISN